MLSGDTEAARSGDIYPRSSGMTNRQESKRDSDGGGGAHGYDSTSQMDSNGFKWIVCGLAVGKWPKSVCVGYGGAKSDTQIDRGFKRFKGMRLLILLAATAVAIASTPDRPPDCAAWGFNDPTCADCDTVSNIVQDEELTDQCRQCCV